MKLRETDIKGYEAKPFVKKFDKAIDKDWLMEQGYQNITEDHK